jgi:hypothetical protein
MLAVEDRKAFIESNGHVEQPHIRASGQRPPAGKAIRQWEHICFVQAHVPYCQTFNTDKMQPRCRALEYVSSTMQCLAPLDSRCYSSASVAPITFLISLKNSLPAGVSCRKG